MLQQKLLTFSLFCAMSPSEGDFPIFRGVSAGESLGDDVFGDDLPDDNVKLLKQHNNTSY